MRQRFSPLPTVLVLAAFALALPACDDSGSDDLPDAERIVATWDVETVNVTTGIGLSVPVLDLEAGGDESTFSFESDGDFSFTFDPDDGRVLEIAGTGVSIPLSRTVTATGTYMLDEAADEITLTVLEGNLAVGVELEMGYDFQGDDELELTVEDPGALALLLGLADEDLTAFTDVVTGGSFALHDH